MAKEYQSEKSPIFDSQKSKKTKRKHLKMSHIKAYKVDQMFCNTRYQGCAWCRCCLCAVQQICSVDHGYTACRGMGSVFVATVTPLPMCADPHHLSMRWMVLSPGGDETQTTDEDAGHLVSCASLVVWEVESG